MESSGRTLILLLLFVGLTALAQSAIVPRLIRGVSVDTLRRFPHHVTIEPVREWGQTGYCSGSILNDQWILTSALCVDGSQQLQLHFEKLYYLSTDGSYTAVVNSDAVHIYPTYYDDIALVKIPFRLIFSDTIKPVNISSSTVSQLEGRLAVMPGFDAQEEAPWSTTVDYSTTTARSVVIINDRSQQLAYAMFNVLSTAKCKSENSIYDEFLQLCTENWSGNANGPNSPCGSNYGSGLLVGWPARSELVGIYSISSTICENKTPAIYTNVAKYASWIKSVIQ